MSAAGSGTSGEEIWRPKTNPWIIAVAVSLAAFMDVLDTSIANVAPMLGPTIKRKSPHAPSSKLKKQR